MQPAAEITFGKTGNAAPMLGAGWSVPEDGFCWTLGPDSHVRVPLRPGSGDLLLDMTFRPFKVPPYRTGQRVGISVAGHMIGMESAQDDSALGFRIPAALAAGAPSIDLVIHCPDALRPDEAGVGTDTRRLGVMMRDMLLIWAEPEPEVAPRRLMPLPIAADTPAEQTAALVRGFTGLSPDQLMLNFESLGANCELGLVQRALGAEPHGLLRFVGIEVQAVLSGLDFGFEGMDDPALMRAYTDGGEKPKWVSVNDRYAIHRHSYIPAAEVDEPTFRAKELRKIAFERRRFLEVLATGQNLFVYQRQESMVPAHVTPILNMLRSHGRNALLFVTLNYGAPAGSVDRVAQGLYRGNIDRLAPGGNARDSNLAGWTSICANAYRMWREDGYGGAA